MGYRTQEQIESLRDYIKKNGLENNPIELVRRNDGTIEIEDGNHRLQIAKELGLKEIPVTFVESWENIGISRKPGNDNIIERINEEYETNVANNGKDNSVNEESGDIKRRSYSYINQFGNRGTRTENARIFNQESIYNNEQESSTVLERNNESIKNSNSSSFSMQEDIAPVRKQTEGIIEDIKLPTKTAQNGLSEQISNIMNNKKLPMQSYQYEKSDDTKIDNLRQDASKCK